jgi:hypothetical protein
MFKRLTGFAQCRLSSSLRGASQLQVIARRITGSWTDFSRADEGHF